MDKAIQWVVKGFVFVFAILLTIWFAKFVFGQIFGTSADTRPSASISETWDGRGQNTNRPITGAPRRNVVKEQFLNDCEANNAPVMQLGGKRMNCYRAPTVTTFID